MLHALFLNINSTYHYLFNMLNMLNISADKLLANTHTM